MGGLLAQFGLWAVVVQTSWGRFCFGGGVVIVPVGNAGTTFHPGCRGVRGGVAGQGERGTVNNTVKFGCLVCDILIPSDLDSIWFANESAESHENLHDADVEFLASASNIIESYCI